MSTSKHIVTAHLDGGCFPRYSMECTSSPDHFCRASWDCDCEDISGYEVVDGKPVHTHYEDNGEEIPYPGKFSPDDCTVREWFINDGSEELSGEVTFEVEPKWEGDFYAFPVKTEAVR